MDNEFVLTIEPADLEFGHLDDLQEAPAPVELAELPLPEAFIFQPLQDIGFVVEVGVEINPDTGWPMYAPSGLLSYDGAAFTAYYETWMAGVLAGEIHPGGPDDPWRIWDMDWSPW